MIIGVGTDLVDVDRLRVVMDRTPTITDRVFTEGEQRDAYERRDPAERFAARFAAKEALLKALGEGLGAAKMRDIEVVRAESGAPSLRLHDTAAALAERFDVTDLHLTMSHTATMAQAVVVAER